LRGLEQGRVRLTAYRPSWKRAFEREAAKLRSALGTRILRIEHVGSTAVKGMDAKPIVDLMAAVPNLAEAVHLQDDLTAVGYRRFDEDDVPGRLFFTKGKGIMRTHHLSLAEPASTYWQRQLLFRDHLRAHPEAVDSYNHLKRDLAQRYPTDRVSYTAGKHEFINTIIELASCELE
jgi:GrpB-like predicted nucleotidyltransferase (UPF0157 family)